MNDAARMRRKSAETELLILPDGRVLVHNLTSMVAAALAQLEPNDKLITRRAFRDQTDGSPATTNGPANLPDLTRAS